MAATTDTYVARLKQRFDDEIRPALKDELELDSIMRVPKVTKITLNMGVGDAKTDAKAMDAAIEELSTIAGQHAQVRRARKSVASFKLREGMAVGARVTLRGAKMYEFLDRLVSIALPRIRDFRGLNPDSFDGRGNYSLGIGSRSSSPRSTTTAFRRSGASTLPSRRPPRPMSTLARCCAISGCRLPPRAKGLRHWHGQDVAERQAEADAEVQDAGVHAVQPLRTAAGGLPQVQALPDLPARTRPRGCDPGHDEVVLVIQF